MFANGLRVAQIVVLCNESVMQAFVSGSSYRHDLQWLQLFDGRSDGRFITILRNGPNPRGSATTGTYAPWRRQNNVTGPMQGEQQAAADHVTRLTVGLQPVPGVTEAYR